MCLFLWQPQSHSPLAPLPPPPPPPPRISGRADRVARAVAPAAHTPQLHCVARRAAGVVHQTAVCAVGVPPGARVVGAAAAVCEFAGKSMALFSFLSLSHNFFLTFSPPPHLLSFWRRAFRRHHSLARRERERESSESFATGDGGHQPPKLQPSLRLPPPLQPVAAACRTSPALLCRTVRRA